MVCGIIGGAIAFISSKSLERAKEASKPEVPVDIAEKPRVTDRYTNIGRVVPEIAACVVCLPMSSSLLYAGITTGLNLDLFIILIVLLAVSAYAVYLLTRGLEKIRKTYSGSIGTASSDIEKTKLSDVPSDNHLTKGEWFGAIFLCSIFGFLIAGFAVYAIAGIAGKLEYATLEEATTLCDVGKLTCQYLPYPYTLYATLAGAALSITFLSLLYYGDGWTKKCPSCGRLMAGSLVECRSGETKLLEQILGRKVPDMLFKKYKCRYCQYTWTRLMEMPCRED